jgi:hypothetical protein
MFQKEAVQKIKTRFNVQIFFFSERLIYETMWKNMAGPDGSQMTYDAEKISFSYWMTKVTIQTQNHNM